MALNDFFMLTKGQKTLDTEFHLCALKESFDEIAQNRSVTMDLHWGELF